MKHLMKLILNLFGYHAPEPCTHERNVRIRKFKLNDGTPMIEFDCFDCGYRDYGYVYTNNWPESLLVKVNGIIEILEEEK